MSSSKSTTWSEKVETNLDDAMANFKMFKKEMSTESRRRNVKLESQEKLLQAAQDELDGVKLELEACQAELEITAGGGSSPDPLLESEKAALKAERLQLNAEKIQLKTALSQLKITQTQLGKDKAVLESEKTQLRVDQSRLKAAQSQMEDAKTHLESTQSQLDGIIAELEIAQALLETAKAETAEDRKRLVEARASLRVAKIKFAAATKQLNAAKSKFESAKVMLDAAIAEEESDRMGIDKAAELQIKVLELESEKSKHETLLSILEDDKLRLGDELRQSREKFQCLSEKAKEVEKQLDQCCKGRSAEVEAADLQQEKVRELERQLGQCCDEKKAMRIEIAKSKWNGNPRVFLDISINGGAAKRIVIELDVMTTPRTAENFRALCTGEKGIGQNGKPLHYKGTRINVASDYISFEGSGESIFGPNFPKENFIKKHIGPGVVSMGNGGSYSMGSWAFITTDTRNGSDGGNVAFGDVVEGMNLVTEIMKTGGSSVVTDCGQLA